MSITKNKSDIQRSDQTILNRSVDDDSNFNNEWDERENLSYS